MAISSGLQGTANTYLLKFIFSVKVFSEFLLKRFGSVITDKDRDRQQNRDRERGLESSRFGRLTKHGKNV